MKIISSTPVSYKLTTSYLHINIFEWGQYSSLLDCIIES